MKKLTEELIKDFLSVRSIITLGAFLTVYWLCWQSKPVPDVILRIVDLLLGFWFGSKAAGKITETKQEVK